MTAPVVKYKRQLDGIEKVEVLRETASSVWIATKIGDRRESKATDWFSYHDTWAAAHKVIADEAGKNIARAQDALHAAICHQTAVAAMREPGAGE